LPENFNQFRRPMSAVKPVSAAPRIEYRRFLPENQIDDGVRNRSRIVRRTTDRIRFCLVQNGIDGAIVGDGGDDGPL